MDTAELEKVYRQNSLENAAKKLGISVPTLLRRVKAAGIEMKGSGRPYKKEAIQPVYISTFSKEIGPKIGLKALGIFYYLLMDDVFIQNGWNGKSGISIESEPGHNEDRMKSLEILYKNNLIGLYEIVGGKISTEILNREMFVLTESEYLKMGN